MRNIQEVDIMIVGAGPAGLATALHLAKIAPQLIGRLVIMEASEHPRHKLCGGGITIHGERQLAKLGVRIDVPAVVVDELVFQLGDQVFSVACPNAMRIIQRAAFDAALADAASDARLCIHSNERLLDLQRVGERMLLRSNRASYLAKVVIAADGANSTVRKKLGGGGSSGVARLLRVLTPTQQPDLTEWNNKSAVFDFSCVEDGIPGYAWDFPCYLQGAEYVNRGMFDSRISAESGQPHGWFKQVFFKRLSCKQVDVEQVELKGHPVRWYQDSAEFAQPNIVFTGDCAGVDPLFAEGISFAIEYGELAAKAVKAAFQTNDFSFNDYSETVRSSKLGKLLRRRWRVAKLLYDTRLFPFWTVIWRMAAIAPHKVQIRVGASLGVLPHRVS